MSYGAAGDGATDDTVALNRACDAGRAINVDGGAAVVYLPAGTYKISGTINVFDVFLRGDGMGASRLVAASDWASTPNGSWLLDQQPSAAGAGRPAATAADIGPAPQRGTWIEGVQLVGPGQVSPGAKPCNISGIRVGQNAGYSRVAVNGFFAGAYLFASGESIIGPGKQGGNYYGIYRAGPSIAGGDELIASIEITGCAWAAIGLGTDAMLSHSTLRSVTLGSSPFAVYKEEATPSSVLLDSCLFSTVQFDSCSNGNIFVNGPSGASGDVRNCTFQATASVQTSAPVALAASVADQTGRTIGRYRAQIDLGSGDWIDNEVQGTDFSAYASSAPFESAIAAGQFSGGNYGPGRDAIARAVNGGKVFVQGSASGDACVSSGGIETRLWSTNTAVSTGDLVESGTTTIIGIRRSTGSRQCLGVAMHSANAGQTVPVARSGVVAINSGANVVACDDPVKPDATQAGCVVTATIGDPDVIGVAQQASSAGVVQILLQRS